MQVIGARCAAHRETMQDTASGAASAPSFTGFTGTRQQGGGYGKPPGRPDHFLTLVEPGTPCGELMRRYWHPVGVSSKVTTDPQPVRILGEDLILFRDGKGRAGLLDAHCAHRGTSLYYGKVEDEGIRCCYHGWLFAVDGTCVEQPCEPGGGRHRDKARQPWYPVEERYGLVFAYMGPLDRMPPLPRYDVLEDIADDEELQQEDKSFYIGGGTSQDQPVAPYSWLQNFENVMDPFHVVILHSRFSGVQFREQMALMPQVQWEPCDHGVMYRAERQTPSGRLTRITQVLLPNVRIVPSIELTPGPGREVAWLVPVDSHHHRSFGVARVRKDEEPLYSRRSRMATHEGKTWWEMTEAEHKAHPDDYEAQSSQGAIPAHSDEHLATSDKGVVMLRRMLAQQIREVQAGGTPLGAGSEGALVQVKAGNYFG
jgi:phenylpropionate dioxygenase-like ring-hydroxylating dioxygenase large terminal subunit